MKIALIQSRYKESLEVTINHTVNLINSASKKADLIVLQELHQGPYFCINESTENFKYAQNFKSDVDFWATVAKENSIVLIASLFEKRASGLYHNSAVVFEKDGTIAGKYRKMHIPDDPGFYEKFYFTPGDGEFEPIDTSVGRLGVLVCWDQWFPEAARLMTMRGADILIYPTAIGWLNEDNKEEKERQLDSWITVQRGHAIANGVPLVAVNRTGFEADDSKTIEGIHFWGNSFAVGAQGEFLAKASQEREEILYVNIDTKQTEEVRNIWPFFRDRRIDAYGNILKRYIDN